ncbi:beta-lactamase [Chroococcidiopsis thermalis PCC 7203]|uniref:Beta-lactamase n=2 Tax=Chroococcidiopsis thermalis TaxID=54299 RepID=K9U3H5_CHRTP|nr:beta-lactamase [Chroococcidiopsis thermalis PCC 7203]
MKLHHMNQIDFQPLVANFQGTTGIIIKTLDSGSCFQFNPNLVFPAASLIELPILWEFFHQCATGSLDLAEEIELQSEDMVIGFGILRQLKPGLKLCLYDLAVLMTVVSDNTATNLLIDKLGIDNINDSIQRIGLTHTILQYKMYDSISTSQDNLTTPSDMLRMLEAFIQDKHLLSKYGDEPLKILEGQQCKNKLHLGIPKGARLANKTGETLGTEHDIGVLLGREETVIIVVMTTGLSENYQGIELCRDVARLVYQNTL